MAWAALESLFRPGRQQITKRLASSVATFLHPPSAERDRAFQRVAMLYEARGSAAHDARVPEAEQLLESFDLARRSLARCLDRRELPNADELITRWKERR
jgi:hypothetical protein